MSEAATGHDAATGHGGAFDAGATIEHHIVDSQVLDLPFIGAVHLPTLHIGSWDLPVTKHAVMLWVAAAIVLVLAGIAARRRALVPGRVQSLVEILVVFVRDELARKNIGPHGDRFVPYLLTTFFFILVCNLIGLVPYGATATSNIGVTAALAGVAFLVTQASGMREYGVVGHFKNLVPHGLPAWLLPIMIPVEILGMLAKPFALCVRLFANMTAGHFVILALLGLIFVFANWLVAGGVVLFVLFMMCLELLVAFLQAYIFALLTSVFIGLMQHEH